MKKALLTLFAALLCAMTANASIVVKDGLVYRCYSVEEGAIVVDMEDDCKVDSLVIPETIVDPEDGVEYPVKKIDEMALHDGVFTVVTLPSSLNYIDEDAFSDCRNLTRIYCFATEPPRLNSEAFGEDDFKNITVRVPKESLDAYKNDTRWGQFFQIEAIDPTLTHLTTPRMTVTTANTHYYSLDGRRTSRLQKGLNIVRQADGSVRKIFTK